MPHSQSLGISQLVHMISNLDITNDYIHAVNSAIFKFIWRKKKDKIRRKVMISDSVKGGIRAPSADVMAKSLNLAWISRFLPEGQTYKESWKVIPSYLLEKFGQEVSCADKFTPVL